MKIVSGMYVQHKYRDDKSSYIIRYIKDGKVYLDSKFEEFWFEANVTPSKRLIHRLLNWKRFK